MKLFETNIPSSAEGYILFEGDISARLNFLVAWNIDYEFL